jgi:hypothetical protein
VPTTLISHFWNEQFLLPYWIRHHLPMFDRAVLIDYGSTDGSREIIEKLAPDWEVICSRNAWFDAAACDREVMEQERRFDGWKITLNTTEFLLSYDLRLYTKWMQKYRHDVQGVWAYDAVLVDHPGQKEDPLTSEPLFLQKRHGYFLGGRTRLLHRAADGQYSLGRHDSRIVNRVVDDGIFVAWAGWSPIVHVKDRKLAIQQRIPEGDKRSGLGKQHIMDEGLFWQRWQAEELPKSYSLPEANLEYAAMLAHYEKGRRCDLRS